MKLSELTSIECIENEGDSDLSVIFEPTGVEIIVAPKERVEVFALSSHIPESRYKVSFYNDYIEFNSDFMDSFWYIKRNNSLICLTEEVYGVPAEAYNKSWSRIQRPWWKFW